MAAGVIHQAGSRLEADFEVLAEIADGIAPLQPVDTLDGGNLAEADSEGAPAVTDR